MSATDDTFRKVRAYAAQPGAGFTVTGVRAGGRVMAVVEVPDDRRHQERWPFEEWRCACGDEAHTPTGGHLGIQLVEDCDGNERGRAITPWLVLFESGSAIMVCEDCAGDFDDQANAADDADADVRGPW